MDINNTYARLKFGKTNVSDLKWLYEIPDDLLLNLYVILVMPAAEIHHNQVKEYLKVKDPSILAAIIAITITNKTIFEPSLVESYNNKINQCINEYCNTR